MAAVIQSVAYHGARKVRQLALCWRVIAFIAHRIGDGTDPDVPAEARRAVDTGSAGPLGHSCDIGSPRQHCLPLHELTRPGCSICTALLTPGCAGEPCTNCETPHRVRFESAQGCSA
jgi:hypothetical protein